MTAARAQVGRLEPVRLDVNWDHWGCGGVALTVSGENADE
jgi:hypothetical protein